MFSRAQKAWLTVFFSCFVIFLYGPVLSIILLAFRAQRGLNVSDEGLFPPLV